MANRPLSPCPALQRAARQPFPQLPSDVVEALAQFAAPLRPSPTAKLLKSLRFSYAKDSWECGRWHPRNLHVQGQGLTRRGSPVPELRFYLQNFEPYPDPWTEDYMPGAPLSLNNERWRGRRAYVNSGWIDIP